MKLTDEVQDPELVALDLCYGTLQSLERAAQIRVLRYLESRLSADFHAGIISDPENQGKP